MAEAAANDYSDTAAGKQGSVSSIAEFDIFKSFYRDDVAVRYRINAKPREFIGYRVTATLFAERLSGNPLATKQLSLLKSGEGELRFDTSGLAFGDYTVLIELHDRKGNLVAGRDLAFPILRRPVAGRLVDVDAQNFIRIKGKRVFPIGIYSVPGSEKCLKDLGIDGFSVIQSPTFPPGAMKEFLDKAHECGLKVWVSLGEVLDFSKDAEEKKRTLSELVSQVGNHPALLMWESIDEAAWGNRNADGLYEGYKFLRALDQNHPVWTNHAPRNLISTLAHYNRATDVAGCDIYPVPEPQAHSDLPDKTIHVVGDEADKSVSSVNGDKPIIMVLQGFGWAELSPQPGRKQDTILPTFEESRFMAYDAILHGALGINYWGTAHTKKSSRFYRELRSLVSELAAMEPVLTADIVTGIKAGKVGSPGNAVQMMRRTLSGIMFIIAINTQNEDHRAEFTLPEVSAKELRVLFERRTVTLRGGKFTDEFTPYAVHIYTDDPIFNPERKEFSAELMRPPEAEMALIEPGNLVENPSFEVDSDGDLVPDTWAANYPLTMQISEHEAHSGKRSLMLVSNFRDFAPLAVEHGIDGIKADRDYILSAWVKTDPPGLDFRIYVEWTIGDRWYGGVLPWTRGTQEWQLAQSDFKAAPDPAGGLYAVVQIRGKGRGWFDDVSMRER
ncbi:MAG: hypothetical protein QME66_11130 [Candidatus Eisenbacteria bacterium]|nr:hypothetical protein [Candidatus Eisenbacteria bacterium]